MNFVNLTPHEIRIVTPGHHEGAEPGLSRTVPPSGSVARVEVKDGAPKPPTETGPFAWIRRSGPPTYGAVAGLPEPEEGAVYLVSILVLQALAGTGREDVYAPDTGPGAVVRDFEGKVVATTRLLCAS